MQAGNVQRCEASPGPISSTEKLARAVYSPQLFDEHTGQLTPEAVKLDELMSKGGVHDCCGDSSGLSVARLDFPFGHSDIRSTLNELASNPTKSGKPRNVVGYSTIVVSDLVSMHDSLSVLDDGKDSYRSHAVIRSGAKKSELRGFRDELLKRLQSSLVRIPR